MSHLENLDDLRMLYLRGSALTEEGAARLEEKIDGLSIYY
jgi:hypothetical protein